MVSPVKSVMLFAQCHALISFVAIVALTNGQDYRYRMYENNYPPAQTAYDHNLPQSTYPYNPLLNQYGQQFNFQNRPLNNQPNRPGTPSYRPNGFNNYQVNIYVLFLFHSLRLSLSIIDKSLISGRRYIITSRNTWSMAIGYSRERTDRFETTR